MSARLITLVIAAFAASATSALGGSWPDIPAKRKVASTPSECCAAQAAKAEKTATAPQALVAPDGFEFVGGESVWQPPVHKYVFRGGKFAHAADCPIALAAAKPATLPDTFPPIDTSPGG